MGFGPGGSGDTSPREYATSWTEDDDMKLWKTQKETGNAWRTMSSKWPGRSAENLKTRWYSDKFKEFAAREFGKGAYKTAHEQGKQERSGARPLVDWRDDDDSKLWEARSELGNKWGESEYCIARLSILRLVHHCKKILHYLTYLHMRSTSFVLLHNTVSRIKFDNRISENHIKNRWYSAAFKRYVAEEHGPSAYQNAKIGRRGAQSQIDWTEDMDMLLWKSHEELGTFFNL